jgi:hypothetical protein
MSSPTDITLCNACTAGCISPRKRKYLTILCTHQQYLFSTYNTIETSLKKMCLYLKLFKISNFIRKRDEPHPRFLRHGNSIGTEYYHFVWSAMSVGRWQQVKYFCHLPVWRWGMRWHNWLRHYATSLKIASSIPDGVGFFYWHNPSGRTTALGSTQPLTEIKNTCGFSMPVMGLLYLYLYQS